MKKVLLVAVFFGYFFISSDAQAEVLKIYPTDDAVAQLYDDDALTEWSDARNFQGQIFRQPFTTSESNNVGNINVRSDRAALGFYRIYRVSKTFDLSFLPENARITSANLNLYKTAENSQGNTSVVVTSHKRENISNMQRQDWNIENFGTVSFAQNSFLDGAYSSFTFNDEGLTFLNERERDIVTLGLLTEYDFYNIQPAEQVFAAGWKELENPGTDFDPYLEIEYEVEGQLTYEQFLEILEAELEGYSAQQKAFFMMWAEKIFSNMEEKTVEQALKSIKVYKKLLVAKKIKSPLLKNIFDHLHKSSKER